MTRRPPPRIRHRLARLRRAPLHAVRGADRPGDTQEPDIESTQALLLENALLMRELGRAQRRCTQWHDEAARRLEQLQAQLFRSRAECIVKETQLDVLRAALDDSRQRGAARRNNESRARRGADQRARNRALESELTLARARQAAVVAAAPAVPAASKQRSAHDERAAPLNDRRVLCVGGRARQMPLYRALVEERGGRFAQACGADEASLPQLRAALAEADIVVLQPRYVCQGACKLVEAHCARAGLRFLQLDKCCLPGFASGLDLVAALTASR
jgi:hypothetical protein